MIIDVNLLYEHSSSCHNLKRIRSSSLRFRPLYQTMTTPPSPSLKTRADLKLELMRTVPPGEESNVLQQVENQLESSRERLAALRTQRVSIMRQISIRERKLSDWKGKIPRTEPPSVAAAMKEMRRLGEVPCHAVGKLRADGYIVVGRDFARALTGVDGFEKVWLVVQDAEGVVRTGRCVGVDEAVCLCLVDVVSCDVKKGLLQVSGIHTSDGTEVTVLDIKPYLSYCESFAGTN